MQPNILRRLALASVLAAILLLSGLNLAIGPRIPMTEIPLNWRSPGLPGLFAPKGIGLWFPVLLLTVAAPAILLRTRRPESSGGIGEPLLLIATCGVLLALQAWHLSAVLDCAAGQR